MRPAIFDALSVFHRPWWAAFNQGLTDGLDPQRASDTALSAVLNVLCPLLGPGSRLPISPDHALFCWDGRRKTEKHRPDKPDRFLRDLERFKKVLPSLVGGAHATLDTEGDDMVATAAWKLHKAGVECVIVSSDKDLHQLVYRGIRLYSPVARAEVTEAEVRKRWAIPRPTWVALALALEGDQKDGIPGVAGIGPKKRQRLMAKLDPEMPLLEAADAISTGLPATESAQFEDALNHTLLDRKVPGVPDPAPLIIASIEELRRLGLNGASITWAGLIGRLRMAAPCASLMDADD